MRFWLIFVLSIVAATAVANTNTVITGTVKNAVYKEVVVYVDRMYLDNTIFEEAVTLNSENKFSFNLEINIPQLITLEYARNKAQLYVEPGTHLDVEFEANSFKFSMRFSGSCGTANEFLRDFRKQFPEETNKFKMRQIKKGIVYYEIEEPMEKKMKVLGQRTFGSEMANLRATKHSFKEAFERRNGMFSNLFSKYITAEIDYDWAYKMVVYGHSFKSLHAIEEDFYNFLPEISLVDDDVLGNKKYRDFLVAFINFRYDLHGGNSNPYIGQFELASEYLNGVPLAFFQADILARGFKKSEFSELLPTYNGFVETVPYNEFYLRAVDAYFSKKPYAIGSPAPDFNMIDVDGNLVSLNNYNGKIVVLNFWASWCRPCINKLESMKTVKSWMGNEEVVFVNVSLERTHEKYRNQVYERSLTSMTNIFADQGMQSEIVRLYDVKAIPEFFIIGKTGNFAKKPNKTDPVSLKSHIESIIR